MKRIKKVFIGRKVIKFSVWDNLARHEKELTARGASADDLQALREAAASVAQAERTQKQTALSSRALLDAGRPYEIPALGWTIAPPTKHARFLATATMLQLKPARASTRSGNVIAVVSALWVLMAMGDGHASEAMRIASDADGLSILLPDLLDTIQAVLADESKESEVSSALMHLLGIAPDYAGLKKKTMEQINRRLRPYNMQAVDAPKKG